MKRPIYKFKDFLRQRFPYPIRKLPLHTQLGCPHREKQIGQNGGCIYCYNPGFSSLVETMPDIRQQFVQGIQNARAQGFEGKFLAYFQTDTNTYGDPALLASYWKNIEDYPDDIVGLAIGTRPDCLSTDIFELLQAIGEKYMVWLELGLQSANDQTLTLINRGHDFACFENAISDCRAYDKILTCAHIILGLPGENVEDMRYTIQELNRLKVHGVKIHHLQVVKNTVLADWFHAGRVNVFSEMEYLELLLQLLPLLSPEIVVHRLIGDIRSDLLIAPRWTIPKTQIIQLLEQRLKDEGIYQGMKLHSKIKYEKAE